MTNLKSIPTLILISLAISVASCNTDADDQIVEAITDEEAVELIAGSVQTNTAGLSLTVETYSSRLSTEIAPVEICGTQYEKTIPYSTNGNVIKADYILAWSYELSCNNFNIPQTALLDATTEGSYSTQRIESNGSSQSAFNISGLQPSADSYVFNGDLSQKANQLITLNQSTKTIASNIYLKLTNLAVDKEKHEINSGTSLFTLTGTTDQGNSFSYEGSISFTGDGKAIVTLNGIAYEITLD